MVSMVDLLAPIAHTIASDGFARVRGRAMAAVLQPAGLRDWDGFAASWDDLGVDAYMADGGRYRRRRRAAIGQPPSHRACCVRVCKPVGQRPTRPTLRPPRLFC